MEQTINQLTVKLIGRLSDNIWAIESKATGLSNISVKMFQFSCSDNYDLDEWEHSLTALIDNKKIVSCCPTLIFNNKYCINKNCIDKLIN